jgi:hypothetical protein
MELRDIFLNSFGRIRSGWRFSIFFAAFFVFFFITTLVAYGILTSLQMGITADSFLAIFVQFSVIIAGAAGLGWLCGKAFEGLPFRALGCWFTKNWLRDLFYGLLIGALSVCFAAAIAAIFGGVSFEVNAAGTVPVIITLGISLAVFVIGAAAEELLLRGYMLQTLARAKLFVVGTVITSVLFASMHNSNPSATAFSWTNTLLAGVWFCVAYYKTRNLWFPFGIHLAWNWFQGSILGINVSGLKHITQAPILRSVDHGPLWLTGGEYGLEGGAACTVALVISTAAIWFLQFIDATDEMIALTGEEKPDLV